MNIDEHDHFSRAFATSTAPQNSHHRSVPRGGSGHAAVAWLLVEAAIVVTQAAARRGFEVAESFLGTLLGHRALGAAGGSVNSGGYID